MNSAVITPCSHFFHAGCLKKWLYVQESCPLCHCQLKSLSQQAVGEPGTSISPTSNANNVNPQPDGLPGAQEVAIPPVNEPKQDTGEPELAKDIQSVGSPGTKSEHTGDPLCTNSEGLDISEFLEGVASQMQAEDLQEEQCPLKGI